MAKPHARINIAGRITDLAQEPDAVVHFRDRRAADVELQRCPDIAASLHHAGEVLAVDLCPIQNRMAPRRVAVANDAAKAWDGLRPAGFESRFEGDEAHGQLGLLFHRP